MQISVTHKFWENLFNGEESLSEYKCIVHKTVCSIAQKSKGEGAFRSPRVLFHNTGCVSKQSSFGWGWDIF